MLLVFYILVKRPFFVIKTLRRVMPVGLRPSSTMLSPGIFKIVIPTKVFFTCVGGRRVTVDHTQAHTLTPTTIVVSVITSVIHPRQPLLWALSA